MFRPAAAGRTTERGREKLRAEADPEHRETGVHNFFDEVSLSRKLRAGNVVERAHRTAHHHEAADVVDGREFRRSVRGVLDKSNSPLCQQSSDEGRPFERHMFNNCPWLGHATILTK